MLSDELESAQRRRLPLGFWLFIFLIGCLLSVRLFVVGLVEVRGQSMEPTIAAGSTCLVLKTGPIQLLGFPIMDRPLRVDDLVVARINSHSEGNSSQVIKRVAAVAGQVLEPALWLKRLRVTKTTRGKPVELRGVTCSADACRVEPGHVFLLSDELKGSRDSRQFGALHETDMVGRIGGCF